VAVSGWVGSLGLVVAVRLSGSLGVVSGRGQSGQFRQGLGQGQSRESEESLYALKVLAQSFRTGLVHSCRTMWCIVH